MRLIEDGWMEDVTKMHASADDDHEDVDGFDLGEVADDFGVDPGDGLKFSGPVFGVVGPADPGGGVRSPLGGHAVVGRLLVGAQWVPPTRAKSVQSLPMRWFKSGPARAARSPSRSGTALGRGRGSVLRVK